MTKQSGAVDFAEGKGVAAIERPHITVELTFTVRCPLGDSATDEDVQGHKEALTDCVGFIGEKLRARAEAVTDDAEQSAAMLGGTSDDNQIVRHRDGRSLTLNDRGMETSLCVVVKSVRELHRSFLMDIGGKILSYFFELTLQEVLDYRRDDEAYMSELPVLLMTPADLPFLGLRRPNAPLARFVEDDEPQLGDRA